MADDTTETAKKKLAEERKVSDKVKADFAERAKGKPTPTQEENDLAALGAHITEHEPDGSDPDPQCAASRGEQARRRLSNPPGDASRRAARALNSTGAPVSPGAPFPFQDRSRVKLPRTVVANALRSVLRAVEGSYRPGPYYLPVSGGWLAGRRADQLVADRDECHADAIAYRDGRGLRQRLFADGGDVPGRPLASKQTKAAAIA